MKKAFFVIPALILGAAQVFAGGGQSGGRQANAAGYTGNLPYAEFDWYVALNVQEGDRMVNDAVNAYIGPQINAKVNIHILDTDTFNTRLNPMLASGTDIGLVTIGASSGDYILNARRGSFYAIENLLNQYGQKTKALFNQGVWDAMTVNGHIYGVPSLKDNCYIIGLAYNEDLAKQLGIDMSKAPYTGSWYKLENWLNEVKAKRDQVLGVLPDPVASGIQYILLYNFALNTILNRSYLAVTNIDGIMDVAGYDSKTVFNFYGTKEYRDYCHTVWRMVQNNILAGNPLYQAGWRSDQYNTFCEPVWGYTYLPEHYKSDNYVSKMIEPARVWTDTSNYHSSGNAISAFSKTPDRIMMFLEMINNDSKLATMLRFGVEGQHWNRNAQGRVELVSNPNVPAYKLWYGHNMGNLTIVDAPEELSGPNNIMLTRMAQINREAKQPALMGFVFDPNPVNTAVASCSAVVEQYQGTLNSGTANTEADVDKFIDEFNAKLKANGLDQILAEAQKQADAFLASRR